MLEFLNKSTGKSVHLSTPLMLTWGVTEWVDEKSGRKSYDMNLQFPREDYSTPNTEKFLENMIAFENKMKQDAVANSKEWLNKTKVSAEVVDALWTPMLRYPKNQETGEPDMDRPPTLRVKLPYYDDEFKCELYNMQQERVFPSPFIGKCNTR